MPSRLVQLQDCYTRDERPRPEHSDVERLDLHAPDHRMERKVHRAIAQNDTGVARCGAATSGSEAELRVQVRWLGGRRGGRTTVDTIFLRSRAMISI